MSVTTGQLQTGVGQVKNEGQIGNKFCTNNRSVPKMMYNLGNI